MGMSCVQDQAAGSVVVGGTAVAAGVGVALDVGVTVLVARGVAVAVAVGLMVVVALGVSAAVRVAVTVLVAVGVSVALGVQGGGVGALGFVAMGEGLAMAIALVGYLVFPTAPPRFLPEWGFIDTVDRYAHVNVSGSSASLSTFAGGRWAVQTDGTRRADSLHERKSDAVARGREVAKNKQTDLVIKNQNGRIADRDSHGNDPFPPRDKKR